MRGLRRWIRTRRGSFSTWALAVIVAVPLAIAAFHPGFPIADVELNSRDVWVTNSEQLLGGRLNRQIDELNGSVTAGSADFDVLQDGDTLFMVDPVLGRVESVDPAFTKVSSAIDVPPGSDIAFGGETLAIVSPEGDLWVITAVGDLQFNYTNTEPDAELGENGHATVTQGGVVIAVSPGDKSLTRIEAPGAEPEITDFPSIGEFQISAVGDHAVILDVSTNDFYKQDGSKIDLPTDGLRLQQVGAESDTALVASGDSLITVNLGNNSVTEIDAGIETALTDPTDVSAPVFLDGCAHGAWGGAQKYLLACENQEPQPTDISQHTQGGELEFRVNRSVIALNNLTNGNVWLVDENMQLVENWEEVTPPEEEDGEEGDEKSSTQSFEDTLAERTEQNRPPLARDDEFGVRPGKTTILPLLDNDTDPDGDVLTIVNTGAVAETTGRLEYIDGGRALQFTAADGFVGTVNFRYTIDDGRPGGVAEAQVSVRVVAEELNEVPLPNRQAGVGVEANQTVSYNVLNDWRDPDGDDLLLVGASPQSGDLVQFTPDGYVTFTHTTSELGLKEVSFAVSDGRGDAQAGTLTVDVQPAGALNPVGTPDFGTAFVNEEIIIDPLENDLSPSGAQLGLLAIDAPGNNATATLNTDQGLVGFSATQPGAYYVQYTVSAGEKSSIGMIRVDVRETPEQAQPPVAVTDTVYLRGTQSTTSGVLANDVSPSGRVLGIQSIEVPREVSAAGVVVEVLNGTLLRVTATEPLTGQYQFTYTVSDGFATSTAGVTVVPVPAIQKHQPPIALDDAATVRAGDIVTVDVLENDYHPDDAPMVLDRDLVEAPAAGLAFVDDTTVRFQAPQEPGQYGVIYRVVDQFGESDVARVEFRVTGIDADTNKAPDPRPLTARVFAGNQVRIDIPMLGVDPDGDSTEVSRIVSPPGLGAIVDEGSNFLVYEGYADAAGTDTFEYELVDTFGATGIGEIKIGVIPDSGVNLPPTALPDTVSIRPGRVATLDVTLNDSDPQGAPIKVSDELQDVPADIGVEVEDRRYVVIEAPDEEMSFTFRYELTNDRGGRDVTYVQVLVTPDAPILPPTAVDQVLERDQVAAGDPVRVDVYQDAQNPGGRIDDLVVSLDGPFAGAGDYLDEGIVEVTPGATRQTIAFRLTNEVDDLSAMAFIIVPPVEDPTLDQEETVQEEEETFDPPLLDPNLPVQVIRMNETKQWNLSDIVIVPSGRAVILTSESMVASNRSNGERIYVDQDTLRFTPERDYRGPASVTFEVTDGTSATDPKGNRATLTLNIIVGDPEFRDVAPEFTSPSIEVEVGESSTIDLRDATAHPNPEILAAVNYGSLQGGTAQVKPTLSGSQLTVATPINTPKGTTVTLNVVLSWAEFTVPGSIEVTVVTSSRAKPLAVDDKLEGQRNQPKTVSVLNNDSNPYPETPLKIIDAVVETVGSAASVTHTANTVSVVPGPSFIGDLVVQYTIEDATQDPDRHAIGRVILTVRDVPDKPNAPRIANSGDRQASVTFSAPATNGEAIDSYEVLSEPGGSKADCTPTNCTFTGLTNGTSYTFTVRAHNELGWGQWSAASAAVTPYGTPNQVATPATPGSSGYANATLSFNWTGLSTAQGGGSAVTYEWETNNGYTGRTAATSASQGGVPAGSYQVRVRAQSDANGSYGVWSGWSGARVVENEPPPPPPVVKVTNAYPSGNAETRCYQGDCVSNTKFFAFSVQNWPSGNYTVTPQFCRGGSWSDIAGSFSMNIGGTNSYETAPWMQDGFADCGVRVIINGSASEIYNTWNW
ncbi:Ig-like domain-containing protein [Salinibacterium sp. ZJ450]|uniref:Ig-like domain-containing protein n=1 Tax=Salinibacterium sp. ZJ450 TaxID=2708338 RepID=UPI0014249FD1|nr:Ig-like domain-containing protein [Salinibacterium sp. ZJ450]